MNEASKASNYLIQPYIYSKHVLQYSMSHSIERIEFSGIEVPVVDM